MNKLSRTARHSSAARRRIPAPLLLVMAGLLSAGAAMAQDAPATPPPAPPAAQTTPPVRPLRNGQITDIKGNVFTLNSRRGVVSVTIPDSAKIEGFQGASASRSDLKVDVRIGVYGTLKDDGSVVADRVVVLPARAQRPPSPPPNPPSAAQIAAANARYPDIVVDTTGAPDLIGFATRAKYICEAWYPIIADYMKSDGFTPPKQFKLIFQEMDGVANTSGTTCRFAAAYFRSQPDDYGAVVHEMTHVIQQYNFDSNPGWLVEALDDYIRFYHYEPITQLPHANPARVGDTPEPYRVGAQFLDWTQTKYDKTLIKELNAAMRQGTYKDDIFKTKTGFTLDELWKAWKATLSEPAVAPKP